MIRVGLVGYGYAGRTFHAPLIRAVEGLVLAAVVSGDAAKVHADLPDMTVRADLATMLAQDAIDVVVIATPNDTHAPLSHQALAAGAHVVVDKPFALDLDEARGVIAAAARAGRHLWVFHNRRWDSDFLTVRAAIERGEIGRATHFESKIDRFRPAVRDRWRERAGAGGGIWFDLGPHLIDQALQLFGLPDRVIASLAHQRDGAAADDWSHAVLTYGERRVVVQAAMLVAGGSARFVVHGTGGSLVKHASDRQEAQLLAGVAPGAAEWGEDPDPLHVFTGEGTHTIAATPGDPRGFYAAVVDALRAGGPGPIRPIEALAVMAVIAAGVVSARDGIAAPLALTDAERASWN